MSSYWGQKCRVQSWDTCQNHFLLRSKKIENVAVEPLKKVLIEKWQELDKMLFCTKIPKCVLKYKKKHKLGGQIVKANLIQNISIPVEQIRIITKILRTRQYALCIFHQSNFLFSRNKWRIGALLGQINIINDQLLLISSLFEICH